MRPWYYYLHENGDLIGKNPAVVDADPEYFNSPFVKRFWKIDLDDRSGVWALVLEALEAGAGIERIRGLYVKWSLTKDDSFDFLMGTKATVEQKAGLRKFVTEILGETEDEYTEWFLAKKKEAGDKDVAALKRQEEDNRRLDESRKQKEPKAAEPPPARPAALPRPDRKATKPETDPGPPADGPALPENNATVAFSPEPRPETGGKADPPYTATPGAKNTPSGSGKKLSSLERAKTLLADVRALKISKPDEAEVVKGFIDKARKYQREVEAELKPEIEEKKAAYDQARAKRDDHLRPLKEAEAFANQILTNWLVEQKRIEIEARKRAEEEERSRRKAEEDRIQKEREEAEARARQKQIEDAAAAKAAGDEAEAQKILQMPLEDIAPIPTPAEIARPIVPAAAPPPAAKIAGASLRETWKWEVENFEAVPDLFKKLVIDEDAIDGIVSKKKGQTEIPGIKVFPDYTTAHRRK